MNTEFRYEKGEHYEDLCNCKFKRWWERQHPLLILN